MTMLMQHNGQSVAVKSILIELTNGEMLCFEGSNLTLPVAVPEAPAPAGPVMATVEDAPLAPVRRRGGGRRKKAEAPAPAAAEPAKPKTQRKAKASQPEGKPKGFSVPLIDCLGVAVYEGGEQGEFEVAVYKTGVYKKGPNVGKRWYLLLYVSKDKEWAYHRKGGFFANVAKLHDIQMF